LILQHNKTHQTVKLRKLLFRLWYHLSKRRRIQFSFLVGLMFISAFAEVASLGAVLPFLGILIAPERVFEHSIVGSMAQDLGITSADQMLLPLTVTFIGFALIAGAIRIFLTWANTRVAFSTGADLGIEVYRRTLYQPYWVHASQNSNEVISGITIKTNLVVFDVLVPLLTIFSGTLLVVAIMGTLIAIDPIIASVAGIGFGICYASVTWVSRRQLNRNSHRVAQEQTQVLKALQEGLGGIRDVLLDGVQEFYCNVFHKADHTLRRAQGSTVFISLSPRYAMEALGMVVIAALAYFLSHHEGGIAAAFPLLGLLALGAQRLLPSLQQIYYAWASIVGSQASLADTLMLLDQPLPEELFQSKIEPLSFVKDVRLNNVDFRYSEEAPWILNGLNLLITKGARVGFVGSTGSGKSTALDLLMGLLMPTKGELLIDGKPVSGERLRAWQRSIAHVPQSIYLADTTLAENIAFGVPFDKIDQKRVKRAARQAQIEDYIESKPQGYNTHVGERGVRLSGGQRQRIGIARALYKQASVLVFDEATSALDTGTEQSVMDAIGMLNRDLTIILIAHRLTTVRQCDIIVELEHGKVVAQGTYEHLLKHSPSFQNMAKAL
jgi:ABC-type multidrug transport system fused ATPase/permease subunit